MTTTYHQLDLDKTNMMIVEVLELFWLHSETANILNQWMSLFNQSCDNEYIYQTHSLQNLKKIA